ncbi:MAG: type II toxin-antitoxin system mRNA interferase toxin, RelE/StbE family [Verrucomicrobia bacterium]|nr:type II toxin-antitoxin system mRNA interferase toxin, RelE/StbE family [Verrucomicrobiota bacterium]
MRAVRRVTRRDPRIIESFTTTLELLSGDIYHPQLKTHKLKGQMDGIMACSVGYHFRILFKIVDHKGGKAILLLSAGTHDEVY